MGCDIHAYVEYAAKDRTEPYWITVGGRINPGRDYDLFAKLANVRNYGGDTKPVMEPRGLPERTSLTVLWDNQLYVAEDGHGDEYCTRENAERWVASGSSVWLRDDHSAVSQPDWHSHSWCTTDEFRSVLDAPREHGWGIGPAWFAVLAMLDELDRRDQLTRLVFWFDN